MVSVDVLEALDVLLWLRTGHRAASYLGCTQSTVSRKSRRCLDVFRLKRVRHNGEWHLHGDCDLIDLERKVHQVRRWQQGSDLRLEAQPWCAHLIPPVPRLRGWLCGNLDYADCDRPLQLLRLGIIDAWIRSVPGPPSLEELPCELSAQPILTTALWPVVKPGHPLLERGATISPDDLRAFPFAPLPPGVAPALQRRLQELDLWPAPEHQPGLNGNGWMDHQPSLNTMAIGLESTLRLATGLAADWQPLPLPLPLLVQEVLVAPREVDGSAPQQILLADLRAQAAQMAAAVPRWLEPMPELVVHGPDRAWM